ncbi:MAG: hypothetical protein LAN64_15130 [Acidobacteriia bacterium]|nr:hypothetical protein [Terriglobia bacterium]
MATLVMFICTLFLETCRPSLMWFGRTRSTSCWERLPIETTKKRKRSFTGCPLANSRTPFLLTAGKKVTISGKDYLIVHPQSGFGYYVVPHADVAGWVSTLQGAQQIANNLYRVAVPNNGKAKVSNKIAALGQVKKDCFGHVVSGGALVFFSGVFAIGLLIYRPKGRTRRQQ